MARLGYGHRILGALAVALRDRTDEESTLYPPLPD